MLNMIFYGGISPLQLLQRSGDSIYNHHKPIHRFLSTQSQFYPE